MSKPRSDEAPDAPALVALCMAVVVATLDTSVVNLAVRPIGSALHADIRALQWVIDAYNVSFAVLLLSGGLAADLFGRRRAFVAGCATFAVASVACALAPSLAVLIAGRILAGTGAAFMIPASLALVRVLWSEERERGRALGIWAGCNGVALAIGPTLGGWLIAWFGWRSIFLIVVPIACVAVALALISIPESSDPRGRAFDAPPQGLGAVFLGGLAFACIEFEGHFLASSLVFAASALFLFLLIGVERKRGDAALVPLDIVAQSRFRTAFLSTGSMTFGMYGLLFLLPLYWQTKGLLGSAGAGVALLPMAIVFVFVSPGSGWVAGRFGSRCATAGGLATIATGLIVIAAGCLVNSLAAMELGLALTGLGMGFATGPLMGAATGAVHPGRSGTASSLINVARMIGSTLGVAVLGSIYRGSGAGRWGISISLIGAAGLQLAAAMSDWHSREEARELHHDSRP